MNLGSVRPLRARALARRWIHIQKRALYIISMTRVSCSIWESSVLICEVLSVQSLCPLCLCGEWFCGVCSPQRHRGHRDHPEKTENWDTTLGELKHAF